MIDTGMFLLCRSVSLTNNSTLIVGADDDHEFMNSVAYFLIDFVGGIFGSDWLEDNSGKLVAHQHFLFEAIQALRKDLDQSIYVSETSRRTLLLNRHSNLLRFLLRS